MVPSLYCYVQMWATWEARPLRDWYFTLALNIRLLPPPIGNRLPSLRCITTYQLTLFGYLRQFPCKCRVQLYRPIGVGPKFFHKVDPQTLTVRLGPGFWTLRIAVSLYFQFNFILGVAWTSTPVNVDENIPDRIVIEFQIRRLISRGHANDFLLFFGKRIKKKLVGELGEQIIFDKQAF